MENTRTHLKNVCQSPGSILLQCHEILLCATVTHRAAGRGGPASAQLWRGVDFTIWVRAAKSRKNADL